MKTAEEWEKSLFEGVSNINTGLARFAMIEAIKLIQLDAFAAGVQQGMTEAAELVPPDTSRAILAARDAKKL